MCNLRFQQIYWGFQRFCPQIVDLRLIAQRQAECARIWRNCLIIPCITLKKPHPCPPTSPLQGDYSLHTSHWGTPTVPPPLEGAGGHAETLWKMCVKSSSPQGGENTPLLSRILQPDWAVRWLVLTGFFCLPWRVYWCASGALTFFLRYIFFRLKSIS